MPDKTYNTIYTTDASGAIGPIDALIAKLTTLDALATQLKPKLTGLAKGAAAPLDAMAKSAQNATANLNNLNGASTQSQASIASNSATITRAAAALASMVAQLKAAAAGCRQVGSASNAMGGNLQTATGHS